MASIAETLAVCTKDVQAQQKDFKAIEHRVVATFMQAAAQAIGELLTMYDVDSAHVEYQGRRY